jgi:phage gp29-like protein
MDDTDRPTAEQRQELASDIYNRGREAVVVLPTGFDLKLLEATANTKNIYEAQIRMADEAIAVAVRGGNLTTMVDGGSRAAIEGQERRGDQAKLAFDAQSLTTTIHDQSLTWWAEFNFGDRRLAPWPSYPVEPDKDIKAAADSANSALDAAKKASDMGFDNDRQAFVEEFGLSGWLKPGASTNPPDTTATEPPIPPQDPASDLPN